MCIEDKVKIVEKKVFIKEKNNNRKPKLNFKNYDDY